MATQVAMVYNSSTSAWDILDTSYSTSTGNFSMTVTTGVAAPYSSTIGVSGSLRVGKIEAKSAWAIDLVYSVLGGGVYTWYYKTHVGANSPYPDQVSSVTDGLGNYAQFTYTSLSNGSPTYSNTVPNAYPVRIRSSLPCRWPLATRHPMVSVVPYNLTYAYGNARIDTQGHGFLGFATRTMTDSRNGNVDMISYDQTFPYVGIVTQDQLKKSNGDLIRETDNAGPDQLSLSAGPDGTQRYAPFFDTHTVHYYDNVGGVVQETSTDVTTLSAAHFNSYGDVTDEVATVTDETQSGNPVYTTETVAAYATASGSTTLRWTAIQRHSHEDSSLRQSGRHISHAGEPDHDL